MLPALAASIVGGLSMYVITRIASGTTGDKHGAPAPVVPRPPAPPVIKPPVVVKPAPLPVPEPEPAPIEVSPPPPAPPPPVDSAPELPTPPAPSPVNPPSAGPAGEGPKPATPPAGFDPALAGKLAEPMATQLRTKKYDYARASLKAFQRAAGVTADGIYGNDTWGALLYYTSSAPRALFKPTTPTPYPWAYLAQASAPAIKIGPAQLAPAPAPAAPAIAPAPPAPPIPELPPLPAPAPPPDVAPAPAPAAAQPPAGFNVPSAKKLAKQVAQNINEKGRLYSNKLLKDFQVAAGITADGLYGGGSRGALIALGIPRPPQPLFKPTDTKPYPWQDRL